MKVPKRLAATVVFALSIVALYQLIDINLFTIDLPRRIRSSLFRNFKSEAISSHEILIIDIGYMPLGKVAESLVHLESLNPKVIGVNLCNIKERNAKLDSLLYANARIITCDCNANSATGSSRITSKNNEVIHFLTDKASYFEMRLLENPPSDLSSRVDKKAVINFDRNEAYYQMSLDQMDSVPIDVIEDKTVIVGFLRDSLITPMNESYGLSTDIPGDMSDAQISANIISTIDLQNFVTEVGPILRITLIIFISLICAGLIQILKTKYMALNIVLALTILIILNALASFAIVLAFRENYYLDLDEMTLVLIVTAIVSVYWNMVENRNFIGFSGNTKNAGIGPDIDR